MLKDRTWTLRETIGFQTIAARKFELRPLQVPIGPPKKRRTLENAVNKIGKTKATGKILPRRIKIRHRSNLFFPGSEDTQKGVRRHAGGARAG